MKDDNYRKNSMIHNSNSLVTSLQHQVRNLNDQQQNPLLVHERDLSDSDIIHNPYHNTYNNYDYNQNQHNRHSKSANNLLR